MDSRFGIAKWRNPISYNQFVDTASLLGEKLRAVNPNLVSKVLLTTNQADYYGIGSLTKITPHTQAALDRRETCNLSDLSSESWDNSYKTSLVIKHPEESSSWMAKLTTQRRLPNEMHFFAQSLDPRSAEAFESMKNHKGWFQRLTSGDLPPSDYALVLAKRGAPKYKPLGF